MTNLEYEEKYGEDPNISDSDIERGQEEIDKQEKIEHYEKCIERIKELVEEIIEEVNSL